MKRSFIREILESIDEETISFAGGLPSENLFPNEDLKNATLKALENPKIYQYGISNGISELRAQIASRYTKDGMTYVGGEDIRTLDANSRNEIWKENVTEQYGTLVIKNGKLGLCKGRYCTESQYEPMIDQGMVFYSSAPFTY